MFCGMLASKTAVVKENCPDSVLLPTRFPIPRLWRAVQVLGRPSIAVKSIISTTIMPAKYLGKVNFIESTDKILDGAREN